MALSKSYGNLVDWAIITVVIFSTLIFGGVFIGKTDEVGKDIITDTSVEGNITALTGDYFTASDELSTVVITVIGFVILAFLLILLFYFIRALRNGGEGKDAGDLL